MHVGWTILVGKGVEPNNRNGGGSDDDVERNLSPSPSRPGIGRCLPLWSVGLSKHILRGRRGKGPL